MGDSQGQTLSCEEGCGCLVAPEGGVIAVIDGATHTFCCSDCADSYQEKQTTETARAIGKLVRTGQQVADIGCGSGFYTAQLAGKVGTSGHVFAVDSDAKNLRRASEYLTRRGIADRATFRRLSAGRLPFASDGTLDFVLSNNVLCCTNERGAAVLEIFRVLKPGGIAYVRVVDITPKGVRPVSTREWERLFADFRRLTSGAGSGVRWTILAKPTPDS
jgi:ubiquinone/menaquinone biosynthesis C-methylase UbiE